MLWKNVATHWIERFWIFSICKYSRTHFSIIGIKYNLVFSGSFKALLRNTSGLDLLCKQKVISFLLANSIRFTFTEWFWSTAQEAKERDVRTGGAAFQKPTVYLIEVDQCEWLPSPEGSREPQSQASHLPIHPAHRMYHAPAVAVSHRLSPGLPGGNPFISSSWNLLVWWWAEDGRLCWRWSTCLFAMSWQLVVEAETLVCFQEAIEDRANLR